MRRVLALPIVVFGLVAGISSVASAQSLGTFRWQLQPFCNVLTLAVTQNGTVFRLEGTDDQCGAGGAPASAIGTAFFNADGSVALGLTLVASPGAAPTHVMARVNIATLGGAWQDSSGHAGAFVLTPGNATGGTSRPPATATIGAVTVGQGLRGGGNTGDVRVELATTPSGAFDLSNPGGVAAVTDALPDAPLPIPSASRQFLWLPKKAAFRVGAVNDAHWADGSIGRGSVAMGLNTIASADTSFAMGAATVARGDSSVALGEGSTAFGRASLAAGIDTTASGPSSLAIGSNSRTLAEASSAAAIGEFAVAIGPTSVALGFHSVATAGALAFSDRSSATSFAAGPNEVAIRAAGGVRMHSNGALSAGVHLLPNASQWLGTSDVNMKENFRDLDADEVLSKIARMPIREWSYKAQDAAIRHMGPTAQDFHAAFGLGEDPLKIGTMDADGVALRAIQALEARTRTQHEHLLEDTQSLADLNDSLVRENADRIAEIAALKAALATLRAEIAALREMRR